LAVAAAVGVLNLVLNATPLILIVTAIVFLITKLLDWIQAMGGLKIAWLVVVNALMTAWDLVKIGFFTGVYWVLDLWDRMKLGMMTAGVAIANFMGDMKANVLMILQNMVNGAINIINGFLEILNKIPGVHIGLIEQVSFGTQAQLANEAEKQARNAALAKTQAQIDAAIADRAGKLDAMKDDARAATAERLAEIDAARAAQQKEDVAAAPSGLDGLGQIGDYTANIADNTKKTADIGEENLKYLRDIAERDTINRFTTAEITIEQHNDNHIGSDMDLDGVVDYLADGAREAIGEVSEGVHR
jgi:hypothetical protein